MKQIEIIKEMYFEEDMQVPYNLEDRLRSLIVCDHPTDREIFLTLACNDFMNKSLLKTENGTLIKCSSTKTDSELFLKLNKELMEIRRSK
jgi:hypothetical protein